MNKKWIVVPIMLISIAVLVVNCGELYEEEEDKTFLEECLESVYCIQALTSAIQPPKNACSTGTLCTEITNWGSADRADFCDGVNESVIGGLFTTCESVNVTWNYICSGQSGKVGGKNVTATYYFVYSSNAVANCAGGSYTTI